MLREIININICIMKRSFSIWFLMIASVVIFLACRKDNSPALDEESELFSFQIEFGKPTTNKSIDIGNGITIDPIEDSRPDVRSWDRNFLR